MKKTISVLVENRPGVLTHVSGLISRRGYNIASIAASSTEEPDITRISLVVEVENDEELEQIEANLAKLITVVKVIDANKGDFMSRELALLKLWASQEARQDIISLADIFRAEDHRYSPGIYGNRDHRRIRQGRRFLPVDGETRYHRNHPHGRDLPFPEAGGRHQKRRRLL